MPPRTPSGERSALRSLWVLLAPLLLVLGGESASFGAPPDLAHGAPTLRAPRRTRAELKSPLAEPPRAHAPHANPPGPSVVKTAPARRWDAHPAVVEHRPKGRVYAVSDIHGRYDSAFKLLSGNRLLRGDPARPNDVVWTGGKSTLVVVGDSINKGNGSVHTVDMLRTLQTSAEKQGGKVIALSGTHEASFIHEPRSARSMRDGSAEARGHVGFGYDLQRRGASPQHVAQGLDAEGRGAWLRGLPFGAVVGNTFFSHSGSTRGMTRKEFEHHVRTEVNHNGYGHENVVGAKPRCWRRLVEGHGGGCQGNAKKLDVKRIVMGHIPTRSTRGAASPRRPTGSW